MKDPIKFVRNAYYELLDGAITYNGSPVSVYDEQAEPQAGDYFIIVSTLTDENIGNKHSFFTNTSIIIDVVTKVNMRLTKEKEIVDAITEKVLNLVLPSIGTTGLSDTNDFQIISVRRESSNHLPVLDSGTKQIVRRVTRFSQIIIEK
jgi:hypothetical protein